MVLYFLIYILGAIVSLVLTLIELKTNHKNTDDLIDYTNNKLSEQLDCYEKVEFVNSNTYCIINFFMSWLQVAIFIYDYSPSRLFLKIHFYRIISVIFIWTYTKPFALANAVVEKHNNLIREFNKKHGIKEE
jgi:hypothetical protein